MGHLVVYLPAGQPRQEDQAHQIHQVHPAEEKKTVITVLFLQASRYLLM